MRKKNILILLLCFVLTLLCCLVYSAPAPTRKALSNVDNNSGNCNEGNNNTNNDNNDDDNNEDDNDGSDSDFVVYEDDSDEEETDIVEGNIAEEEKKELLNNILTPKNTIKVKKPDDLKNKPSPKKCIHPNPNGVNIVRNDGFILGTAKVNSLLKVFTTASDVLNNMGGGIEIVGGGCSPVHHPGMMCIAHVNLDEDVYDISIVTPEKYARLKSLVNLRKSILIMNDLELYDFVPKRHAFYWEEYKIHPPDRGHYREQQQAERDIAHLSNAVCIPTTALYPSSTHAYMRGPPDVTIRRPEQPPNEQVATIYNKPYGQTKYHELNHEWADEFNRRVPPREFENLEKVKCLVLIEKEGFYKLTSGILARDHGCISVLLHGQMVRAVVWFIRAIKARDHKDKIKLYTMSDMDLRGLKIAHQLAKDWNDDTIRFISRSRGDYLHLRFQTCWMGIYPTEYHRLNVLAPLSGTYKPMTMSDETHNAIVNWQNSHPEEIAYNDDGAAPPGAIRNAEIDQLLDDRILFNIAKIPPHLLSAQLGFMLENAHCPVKWSNLKSPHGNMKNDTK